MECKQFYFMMLLCLLAMPRKFIGYGSNQENVYVRGGFLESTAGLRKEIHDKRFEYMEAWRAGDGKKACFSTSSFKALSTVCFKARKACSSAIS